MLTLFENNSHLALSAFSHTNSPYMHLATDKAVYKGCKKNNFFLSTKLYVMTIYLKSIDEKNQINGHTIYLSRQITSFNQTTAEARFLELGYLEFCETRSVYLNQKYILIAFSSHNLALGTFFKSKSPEVQINLQFG